MKLRCNDCGEPAPCAACTLAEAMARGDSTDLHGMLSRHPGRRAACLACWREMEWQREQAALTEVVR